eukprot:gene13220-15233_t
MFGYIFGFVALFSPFGRVVTICRSTDYYFRANQDSEEKCKSLNRWSTKLILQGITTTLDVLAVIIALPCILLVPSVWTPTYNGLMEINLPENLPKDLTNTKNYQRSWMDGYYPLVRLHLFNQVFHALMDLLLLPLFLLVCISPLRQPALWRAINVNKAERIRQEKGYARYRPDVSAFDYYYSFDLRADLCVLALLALADLLLLPMMLPLWLTQYRFTALKEELWSVQEEPAVVNETEKIDPALSSATPDQDYTGDVTNAELHDIYADIEASRDPQHTTHTESDLHGSQSAPASGASQLVPSTDAPAQEPPRSKLLGMGEFFLVSSQATLLFVDIFMLALPLPILYLTALRWGPVGRALREEKVFLKNSSGLYGTVLEQMSLLLLDVVLAPFAGLILLTIYRSSAMWEVLSSLALIEALGNKLHWMVILNTLCILHDVFLLTPAVLLLPCFLAGYRFSIVYDLLAKHIEAQKKERSDLQTRRDARSVVLLASETDNAAAAPVAAINNQSFIQGVDLVSLENRLSPPGTIRSDLWAQCGHSIIDVPFLVMGFIVMVTVWRAWELVAAVCAALPSKNQNDVWKCVFKQLCWLIRDMFFLLPALVVVGTLYRLPQMLGQFIAVLLSGGASLTTNPILDVESCLMDFPARGGPAINFSCRRAVAQNSAGQESDVEGTPSSPQVILDPSATVELHVIADTVWEYAAQSLGKFLVSLIRSYLPLKLMDKQSIGWSEFVNNAAAADLTTSSPIPSNAPAHSLWLRLDFGTTKRTTIAKKLQLIPASAVLILQLEAYATVASTIPGEAPQRKKVVLLRVSPTIEQLKIMLTGPTAASDPASTVTAALPMDALLPAANVLRPDWQPGNSRKGNFVNSFNTIVSQSFLELCLDLLSLVMVLLTVLSPMRFVRLVVALLEPERNLPLRVCTNVFSAVGHLDTHLLEYRKQSAGPLNKNLKAKIPGILVTAWRTFNSDDLYHRILYMDIYFDDRLSLDIRKIEKYHMHAYRSLCKRTLKSLSYFAGCEGMEALLNERLKMQDKLLYLWFLRMAAEVYLMRGQMQDSVARASLALDSPAPPAASASSGRPATDAVSPSTLRPASPSALSTTSHNNETTVAVVLRTDTAARYDLVLLVLTEEHDRVAMQLRRNEAAMKALLTTLSAAPDASISGTSPPAPLTLRKRVKQVVGKCGLLTRAIGDSRKLIMLMFLQAMSDLGFVALLLFLVVTMVRALPLLKELHDNNAWSPLRYTTRWILIKNVKHLYADLKEIARLTVFVLVIIITVGGIPSFLVDLPEHMSSYMVAADCARRHAKKVFKNICNVLSLVFAFRTYRIVFKAALYCAIIPGACLAEALPWTDLSAAVRFTVGIAVWAGLLIGSVIVNASAVVNDDPSSSHFTQYTRMSLLGWCAAVFGVLLAAALSVCARPAYVRPDSRAISTIEMSWSHILAVLTGPVESIQLSTVILYFFWNYTRAHGSSGIEVDPPGSAAVTTLGSDAFAAVLFVWAPDTSHANVAGSSVSDYRTGVMVAALLVLVWAFLVAAPIATSTSEGAARRAKVLAFKNAPVYEFLMVALSRLLTVWIIASLMRSSSCVLLPDSTTGSPGFAVLSTSQEVSCGDGDWWASLASLSLLTYYMLTTSVLHADDADLLRNPQGTKNLSAVKFAPLYALGVRLVQFFVCAACFTGFYAQSALISLVPILVVVVFGSLLPALICLTQSGAAEDKSVCSVSSISTLRSAGFVCVGWTTIVCIVRASGMAQHGVWHSENTVYVGWGVVYFLALLVVLREESTRRARWAAQTKESGLGVAVEALLETIHTATVSESVYGRLLNAQQPTGTSKDAVVVFESRLDKLRPRTLDLYQQKVRNVRSYEELAKLVLSMEEDILAERLRPDFLRQRVAWVNGLHEIISHEFSDVEAVEAPFANSLHRLSLTASYDFSRHIGNDNDLVSFHDDRSSFLAQLMELGFAEADCRRGLEQSHYQSVEAAVEWITSHPQQQPLVPQQQQQQQQQQVVRKNSFLQENGTSSPQPAALVPAGPVHPTVPSRVGQRLLLSIHQLRQGIRSDPSVTHLSRQVVTLFLSRRLPN